MRSACTPSKNLVTRYGNDPLVTDLLDSRTFYIMPKVNPDGSDHAITKPDGMRSVVRPFDDDEDGQADEDPPEDLNGDGYITRMRIRDDNGSMRTLPEDPRLMISKDQGKDPAKWKGEWTVYSEGIDNDNDGRFNEDGTGGIDINRNFPELWLPAPYSTNPGPYPLSELESRALADFLLSVPNLTGHINYHMTGNVTVFPPSSLRLDPITGDVVRQPYTDELTYKRLGNKSRELVDNVEVQVFKIHGASPASWHGSIWGVYVDWVYFRLGIFSMIHEFGISPGVTDIFPSSGKQTERIRWSDENMGGKLFVDWTPYDHPQLGKIEIGGFLDKIYDSKYKTYTNVQCLPGPKWEQLLDNHTKWHLYLMGQSPLVRITDAKATPLEGGYFKVNAHVQNVGFLPTNVTEQSIESGIARTVKASITLEAKRRSSVVKTNRPGAPFRTFVSNGLSRQGARMGRKVERQSIHRDHPSGVSKRWHRQKDSRSEELTWKATPTPAQRSLSVFISALPVPWRLSFYSSPASAGWVFPVLPTSGDSGRCCLRLWPWDCCWQRTAPLIRRRSSKV